MAKLNKTLGNVEKCPTCKIDMMCAEIEYKGEKKLQWQVAEKAHYSRDSDGTFHCVQTQQKVAEVRTKLLEERISLKDIDLPMDVLEQTLFVVKSATQFLKAIEFGVSEQLPDTVPAHRGLYVKIIAEKLLNLPNLQTILEDVGKKTKK